LVRSKRATTSVYPDDERADGQDLSESTIDQRVASYGNPEDEHLQSERLDWLGEHFKADPELLEILRLQLERLLQKLSEALDRQVTGGAQSVTTSALE
jgi:hypothetical protein